MAAIDSVFLNGNAFTSLKGGRYSIGFFASAWNGASVQVFLEAPDNTNAIPAPAVNGVVPTITGNGFVNYDLPDGQDAVLNVSGAPTGLLVVATSIPNLPEYRHPTGDSPKIGLNPVSVRGGRYMYSIVANFNNGTLALQSLLPDGVTYITLKDVHGSNVLAGAVGLAAGCNLVDVPPGQVKLTAVGSPNSIVAALASIPKT